jgi:hypothetical protein
VGSRWFGSWPKRFVHQRRKLGACRFNVSALDHLAEARRGSGRLVDAVLCAGLRTECGARPSAADLRRLSEIERRSLLADIVHANARILLLDIFRVTRRVDVRSLLHRSPPEVELERVAEGFIDAYLEADIIATCSLRSSAGTFPP